MPLLVAHVAIQGMWLIPRFATHGLVPIVALLAIGFEGLLAVGLRSRPLVLAAGLTAGVVAFGAFGLPATRLLMERRESPVRDVAEHLRRLGEASPAGAYVAGFGNAGAQLRVYLPELRVLRSKSAFQKLRRRARRHGRPLYVAYGIDTVRKVSWMSELVKGPQPLASDDRFQGLDQVMIYHVVRFAESGSRAPLREPPG